MRKSAAWRKKSRRVDTDPGAVLSELKTRQLGDLDRCRVAWEEAGDPLAVVAAVAALGGPEWLVDAVIVAFSDDDSGRWRKRLKAREKDLTDRHRATAVASARVLGLRSGVTWEMAYVLGERLMRRSFPGMPHVGPAAMKKSYQATCRGLSNQGRYHLAPVGFPQKLMGALDREIARLEKKQLPKKTIPNRPK